tara:strand:+ start:943 stop:1203 length:261 start_codon:yes stop_codon:yes gene_type:complete
MAVEMVEDILRNEVHLGFSSRTLIPEKDLARKYQVRSKELCCGDRWLIEYFACRKERLTCGRGRVDILGSIRVGVTIFRSANFCCF